MHVSKTRPLLVVSLCALFILSSVCIIHDIPESGVVEKPVTSIDDSFEITTDSPIWNYTYDPYGTNVDNRGFSITETSDGGLVAVGQVSNANIDLWAIRVDANGTELWNTTIDNGSTDRAWDVIEVSTGGFAACGYVRITSWNYFYLVKFDDAGNVDWMKNYTGRSDYEARALVETDDGGFILVGRGHYGGGMYVVRTDENGTLVWDTTIYQGDTLAGYDVIDLSGSNGYIVAGGFVEDSESEDDMFLMKLDETGNHLWNSTHGGPGIEYCFGLAESDDGGYAICGTTASWGAGSYDMYLVKYDSVGTLLWNQTYGGSGTEMCQSITNAADGGYALAGYAPGAGGDDIWIVRTDSEGEVWWTENIHHSGSERPSKIVEVHDGGYAFTGYVDPSVGDWDLCIYRLSEPRWDPEPNDFDHVFDVALVEDYDANSTDGPITWEVSNTGNFSIDASGVLQNATILAPIGHDLEIKVEDAHGHWIQTEITITVMDLYSNMNFGLLGKDQALAVTEAPDGDFVVACITSMPFSGDTQPWIVRYNSSGEQEWDELFDMGYVPTDIITCSTGGYVAVGYAYNLAGSEENIWLLKIGEDGKQVWNRTFIGEGLYASITFSRHFTLVETPEGGFMLCGGIQETAGGPTDFWAICTDNQGYHLWNETYGYSGENNWAENMIACDAGGYALTGYTYGSGSGNVDAWLVRIDGDGTQLWNQSYGEPTNYRSRSVAQLSDGGYALTGEIGDTNRKGFIIRTNSTGHEMWLNPYGGADDDLPGEILQLHNGTLAMAGESDSFTGDGDGWLLLVDLDGNLVSNDSYGQSSDIEKFTDMVEMSVGGLAFVGQHRPPASLNSYCWFIQKPMLKWTEQPTNQTIQFGDSLSLQLKASSAMYVRNWWVSNQVDFKISQQGLLSNATTMPIGDYTTIIRAFDHVHNVIQATITVSVIDTEGPVWITAPTDQIVEYGETFALQLDASDPSGISEWVVDDMVNFTISSSGLVTNNTALVVGVYGLNISVLDIYDTTTFEVITISVADTIYPEWVIAPSDQVIDDGEVLHVQFGASDLAGIGGWSVNDTGNFNIDSTGLLTNNTVLPIGNYGLRVSVWDAHGNLIDYEIRIRVLYVPPPTTTTTTTTTDTTTETTTTTPPQDDDILITMIVVSGAGVAVVIVVIFVMKKKRG